MNSTGNILVVDDHQLVCDAIAALVERTGKAKKVFPVYTGADALELLTRQSISIAIIDARMMGISGIELSKIIAKEYPNVKLISMTSYDDNETILEMLQLNTHGLILKRSTNSKEIATCLDEVISGKKYYTEEILNRIQQNQLKIAQEPRTHFNAREMQILNLLCRGQSSKQIGEIIGLKQSTIEDYRKEMLKKTQSGSVAELISFAMRNGLL